jgi:tRNA-dihydrouridine synthase B
LSSRSRFCRRAEALRKFRKFWNLFMQIGPHKFDAPFCQAGLAGYSDRAMRLVARRRGCPYAVTEALLDVILLSGGEGLRRSIDINDEDHPIAGQIMGSEPETMARAAVILWNAGYDVIDLNFACPVKKIKNKARGGHMLTDVPRALSILRAVRDVLPSDAPTTVKLRRGFDDSAESEDRFYTILETAWELGYAAVCVHGRTVEQKYVGPSRWSFLAGLKKQYPNQTILGSGDVFTAEDAVRMLRETGVDGTWIARGAIGNPWIFQQARDLLAACRTVPARRDCGRGSQSWRAGTVPQNSEFVQAAPRAELSPSPGTPGEGRGEGDLERRRPLVLESHPHPNALPEYGERGPEAGKTDPAISQTAPPTLAAQRNALREHFAIAMEIHGEQLAGRRMRKMGIKYSRFHPNAAEVKSAFILVKSLRDWTGVLERFYSADGPGVWPDPRAADEVNGTADMQTCEAG